jgi:hypothetical protein
LGVTGSNRVLRAQLRIDRHDGQTRIRVESAGLSLIRLINALLIARKVRQVRGTALGAAPAPE